MIDLSKAKYFPESEQLVQILINKTQNHNPLFFRVLIAFYFAQIATMMRVSIKTHDRGELPTNVYAINLAHSGTGKTFSSNIIEEYVIGDFKRIFMGTTFPNIASANLKNLAQYRANKYNMPLDTAEQEVERDFTLLGPLAYTFDSGSTPAVKQMRQKLLMANCGSLNLVIDEVGSNLVSNTEVLNTFLELYDVGKVGQKLTKNTLENKRIETLDGKTPTNMLLYGTPAKLLNGSKTEEEFYSMLETGYARRCLFGYAKEVNKMHELTPEQVYDMLTDKTSDTYMDKLSRKLASLAHEINYQASITISKDVTLKLLAYKIACEKQAIQLKDHQEILKAELSHRYNKAIKLAGAYAFISNTGNEITEDILLSAIKLVEESGQAFAQILNREREYVRLAKYIANIGREVTQVDLVEDLPFYKGSELQKKQMMSMAIAYGYKHSIVIKKTMMDGIEFFIGESMDDTDLNKIKISYSTDITKDYAFEEVPWDKLYQLVTADGYHYTAHGWIDGYRSSDRLIQGFNLAIVDVDGGVSLNTAKYLLKDYTALFATTKRHTDKENRFRIIFPLSHTVKLDAHAYSKFMKNLFAWLPFEVDDQTFDVARKWMTNPGSYSYQEGELLDVMMFIPETKKQEEQTKKILDNASLSNLERWFLFNIDSGNRNNQILKLALAMVDSGYTFEQCKQSIFNFNNKLKDPLPEDELNSTIMVTVMKKISEKDRG